MGLPTATTGLQFRCTGFGDGALLGRNTSTTVLADEQFGFQERQQDHNLYILSFGG